MTSLEILAYIACVLVLLVGSLHVYLSWNYDYWRKRHVPHNSPYPVFGSLTFLMGKSPTDWFIEQYRRFPDQDYFGIWLFRRPALVVRSPELARRILVKDFDYFHDRFLSSGKSDPLGALNIFTVNDPLWSSVRRRLSPVFTSVKLRALMDIINYYANDVIERINRDHVEERKPTDLREMFSCFTTDVIGAVSLGVQEHATRNYDSTLRQITREVSEYTFMRGIEFASIFFMPSLTDVLGFKFWTKKMSAYFRKVFWAVAEERVHNSSSKNKDLLDALISIRNEAREGDVKEITDDVIVAQAVVFVQGGFDTTGNTLTFFFFEMAQNPDIQRRLYEELKSANPIIDGKVDYSIVKELPYLSMCIKENLRKYIPMGWFDRIADRDYKLDDKLTIEKGTPVYVNAVGMHYDEKYFPNPTKFDPERFSPENEVKDDPIYLHAVWKGTEELYWS